MVIDLAVKNDPDRLILIGHWLGATFDIDDAQTAVPQRYRTATREAKARTIRPTMGERSR